MNETEKTEVEVLHQEDKQRYVVCVNGQKAGLVQYVPVEDKRVFVHTETFPEFSGQGLAVKLVSKALASTVKSGKRIVPVCPFVAGFVKRNTEFNTCVDPVSAEVLDQLRESK